MTTTIDTTVNRHGDVQICISDGERQIQVVFEDIGEAKKYHRILGFQIKRAERANAMKGDEK